jgi:hypothetical protein
VATAGGWLIGVIWIDSDRRLGQSRRVVIRWSAMTPMILFLML